MRGTSRRRRRPRALAAVAVLALCSTACGAAAAPQGDACQRPDTFADRIRPTSSRHVMPSGDDQTGDGSLAHPFRSIQRALQDVQPGTAITIHPGTYAGDNHLTNIRGTATAPIWIRGESAAPRPVIHGGHQGFALSRPRYLVIEHLEIEGTDDNGINLDDADEVGNADAARFVVIRDLDVHDTGRQPDGVPACVKLAGVNDFTLVDNRFVRCGRGPESGASGVNGVGTHDGRLMGNRFERNGYGGVQFKGGASEIDIVGNAFLHVGWRAVNMGGSTSRPFFRPPLREGTANVEAARIRVSENVFVGGETAAAFTGCIECAFTRNTVVDPSRWLIRILQETVTLERFSFAPAGRSRIADNVFFFTRAELSADEDINVGRNTDSASFTLSDNVFYAHDNEAASAPRIPSFLGPQSGTSTDRPTFVDESAGDYRVASGPAGAASSCPALPPRAPGR